MSVESSQLERSVLEKKDREELQSIAVAMGGKPGSRARKADIVSLILELAGVTESPDNGAETEKSPPAEKASSATDSGGNGSQERAAEASSDSGRDGDDDGATTSGGASEGADTTPGQDEQRGARGDRDRSDRDKAGQDRSDRDKAGQDRSDRDKAGQDRSDRDKAGQDKSDRDKSGGDKDTKDRQNKNKDTKDRDKADKGGGDQAEAGNRRRRRRGRGGGRDRDREDDSNQAEPVEIEGLLDLRDEGYGFIRTKSFLPTKEDVYVSVKLVRQFGLRKGDHVTGLSRPANRNEKNPALQRLDTINGRKPDDLKGRRRFEDLTPLFPDAKLRLERDDDETNMTARIIDLISPIGKGQRGLIVSPPKAGKTTVMKTIAQSIEHNNPEVQLIVLLVDERPEEVTDMRRSVQGEVVASTFDRPSDEHAMVAELTIERAKRLVEDGKDVVVILDGITRLARAYNLAAPATGRIMSGGIDTGALYPPKKFFGAARNIEEGGSLTILATALVETGSKMDEVIFEEFKGTGNMELRLDRGLAERRIYPAIDVDASSTRHEELLFERKQLQQVWKLRRVLSGLAADSGGAAAGLEMLIDRLSTFENNDEFLAEVAKAPTTGA